MGLAKRVIPTLLADGPRLVKGRAFGPQRVVGHVLQAARVHQVRGVDELCVLDVTATAEGRGPDAPLVSMIADGCFMPLTVGGGVRSVADVDRLLRAGADKVCMRTVAMVVPAVVVEASRRFGSQAIVVSVDAVSRGVAVELAKRAEGYGAGEILLTCVEREGTMAGYDLGMIEAVSAAVSVPVVARGGCGGYDDMVEAVLAGASAVAVGALFAFSDATPRGAVQHLADHGIEVRL